MRSTWNKLDVDTRADELRHFEVGLDGLGGSDRIGWMDLEWVVGCKTPILQGYETPEAQEFIGVQDFRGTRLQTPGYKALQGQTLEGNPQG